MAYINEHTPTNLFRKMPVPLLRHSATAPLVKIRENSGSHFHWRSMLEIHYVKPWNGYPLRKIKGTGVGNCSNPMPLSSKGLWINVKEEKDTTKGNIIHMAVKH